MILYNTLTKKKEELKTIVPESAGIYTCGPTVYNYAHIGNMRTYIFEDTLKRVLLFLGFRVTHVMNVTDVGHLVSDSDEGEDKMEVGAAREGKSAWEIARFYTEAFFQDFSQLNCLMPDIVAKATDHIEDMIILIRKIEEKGLAYKTSDGIYFDTSKFPDYGILAGKSYFEGIRAGARIECSKEKRNPTDFALWKFSPAHKKRQMEWNSPWGKGFPGWHIECSAMSMKYLGENFDIHCGGVDHIPVHHTNEIAQAEAATGKKFVNYWLHGEFLVMPKSEKMAKSADNFITVSRLKEKGLHPLAYRYFCHSAHYRKQLEFSWEALESAQKSLDHLKDIVLNLRRNGERTDIKDNRYYLAIKNAIEDDLNIPRVLSSLWEALRDEKMLDEEKYFLVTEADRVLGLNLTKENEIAELKSEHLSLIREREEAREKKDFKKADAIRRKLAEEGIILQDTPRGTIWKINRMYKNKTPGGQNRS